MNKPKILFLVEGAKTDVRLMQKLLSIYGFDQKYELVSYNTNIYTLYNEMFRDNDPADLDLLQVLKEHERDPRKKPLFDQSYSDILLIFDLDPQDSLFTFDKIQRMTEYFVESSDMGKLYLNYPMVEAFYHMHDIPDAHFNEYFATQEELSNGTYKQRVNQENRNRNYTKFAVTKEECNAVIQQNLEKARWLCNVPDGIPDEISILSAELRYWEQQMISVLCTCVFYIPEYDPKLII